ncbi:MAG: YqaJ viral recombinase family protein, partial [Acidobacteria bacterium]|nr:YqaJ viral recombinase family protein [Acidobacteriota bacterium]
KDKTEAAGRYNYRAELVVETLTGIPSEQYQSREMLWGIETEPFARAAYELAEDVTVNTAGFVIHPEIERFGASPDGLVGDDGLVEIKCPNTATHIEFLQGAAIPVEYGSQVFAVLACTGREWCDFASYDPRLPEHLRLFVRRIYRDEGIIRQLEAEVQKFLDEVDETIAKLSELENGAKIR